MTQIVDEGLSTRQRLIHSTMRLWAEFGTKGVSLRQIVRAAEVGNDAAIRYHFRNKDGLLKAVTDTIASMVMPLWRENLEEVKQIEARDKSMVRAIIQCEFSAFYALRVGSALGKDASVIVARLVREEGRTGQDLLIEMIQEEMAESEVLLAECLPHKSRRQIRLHHFLAINSIVNGLVDQNLLKSLPDPNSPQQSFLLEPDELLEGFINYVVAGLSA